MNTNLVQPPIFSPWTPGKGLGISGIQTEISGDFLSILGFDPKNYLSNFSMCLILYNHKIIRLPFSSRFFLNPKKSEFCIRVNIALQSDDVGASVVTLLEMFVRLHRGSLEQESHSCRFIAASVFWFCSVLMYTCMISRSIYPTLVPKLTDLASNDIYF